MEDRYLGDGVYAGFDGYQVKLDLRGQDNITQIFLDPYVMESLEILFKDIRSAQKAHHGS